MAMEKTAKIMASAVTLGDFTAAELSRFSRVKLGTVNTTLRRYSEYFDRVFDDETPRKRGGRSYRYSVSQDSQQRILKKFNNLFSIQVLPEKRRKEQESDEIMLIALTAAQELAEAFTSFTINSTSNQDSQLKHARLLIGSSQNLLKSALSTDEHDENQETLSRTVNLVKLSLDYCYEKLDNGKQVELVGGLSLADLRTNISRELIQTLVAHCSSDAVKNIAIALLETSVFAHSNSAGSESVNAGSANASPHLDASWVKVFIENLPYQYFPSSQGGDVINFYDKEETHPSRVGSFSIDDMPLEVVCMFTEYMENIPSNLLDDALNR